MRCKKRAFLLPSSYRSAKFAESPSKGGGLHPCGTAASSRTEQHARELTEGLGYLSYNQVNSGYLCCNQSFRRLHSNAWFSRLSARSCRRLPHKISDTAIPTPCSSTPPMGLILSCNRARLFLHAAIRLAPPSPYPSTVFPQAALLSSRQ